MRVLQTEIEGVVLIEPEQPEISFEGNADFLRMKFEFPSEEMKFSSEENASRTADISLKLSFTKC